MINEKLQDKKITKIKKIESLVFLFYFYKSLLTTKQQEVFEFYYFEDLSINEISLKYEISKVAVFDNLKKTEIQLQKFEALLKINEKSIKLDNDISLLYKLIESQNSNLENFEQIKKIMENIKNIF